MAAGVHTWVRPKPPEEATKRRVGRHFRQSSSASISARTPR
ncbi:hypothetical protein SAMN05216532_0498 [Streptomyces sp. 2231.1]|nr:hypothetical protein SAMN05216532_0498 [Streptomyces sp. 2231.1]